jgi:hypothetical protein
VRSNVYFSTHFGTDVIPFSKSSEVVGPPIFCQSEEGVRVFTSCKKVPNEFSELSTLTRLHILRSWFGTVHVTFLESRCPEIATIEISTGKKL